MEASALTNQEDNVSKAFMSLVKGIVHTKETAPDPPAKVQAEQYKQPVQIAQSDLSKPEEKKGCC